MRQVRSALDENKRLRKELAAQAGAPAEVTNEAAQAAARRQIALVVSETHARERRSTAARAEHSERISRAGGRCLDPNLDPIAV